MQNKKEQKKILYIVISSQTGGVPKFVVNALNYGKKHGIKICVAAPNDGEYFSKFQDLAEDTLDLSLKPYSFLSLWKLRNYIRKNHIQLVHSHGKGAGMYARPLKLLCPGIKVVHTYHGIYLEEYGALFAFIYKKIERILKTVTDAAICVSPSEKKEALRLHFAPKKKTAVIPNGVEPEVFVPKGTEKQQYAKEFGLPEDSYIIGCVARFEWMKGHRYLLAAFKQFLKQYPNSYLLLVGDGPEKEKIEKQIKESGLTTHVIRTGFREDIPGLLQYFDVFVSASLKEGMPFTLLEALAAGTPVLATRVIGNQDVIQDGYNGMLVEAKSSKELCHGLCLIKDHPEIVSGWSQNGKKTIKRHFTVRHSLERTFAVYEKLVWTKQSASESDS